MLPSWVSRYPNVRYRIGSLLAYSGVGVVIMFASSTAQRVYNEICPIDERFLYVYTGFDWLPLIVMVAPVLLARSNTLVRINFGSAIATLFGAMLLLISSRTVPLECVTMGGDYEDHASGLPEFSLCFLLLVLPLSYLGLAIDLSKWSIAKFRHLLRRELA